MVLEIQGWQLEVDIEATESYAQNELKNRCDCGYCRNFYASVDGKYPKLRPFLKQFGLELDAPDEMMPYEPPTVCEVEYAVCGRIIKRGTSPVSVDGLTVSFEEESQINHDCPGPNFFVNVGILELPWVLDEPMEDVVSTANEPSFMKKIINRLLGRL